MTSKPAHLSPRRRSVPSCLRRERPPSCLRPSVPSSSRNAFTLPEVLATLVLLGILLPVTMRGASLALASAATARHTAEATSLAQTKLQELILTQTYSTSDTSGDFGTDSPRFRWTCQGIARDYGTTELTLSVFWTDRGQERSVSLSTLAAPTGASP